LSCRVLIVEDHEIVRQGLRSILSPPACQIVGEAVNGREAVELARACKPDVVVMDISMPEMNGLEATRRILAESPGSEVLVLTVHDSEHLVRQVLDAGARGYMLKSDPAAELIAAVAALRDHRPFLTTRVSEMVLAGYLRQPKCVTAGASEPTVRDLTGREREIVQLLAEGLSNKEIANRLNISVKTAETHRSRIMAKLRLRSVGALVRYAVRNGIVQA
jgi:DNA-binding NarL/FixJ family response regulator